ncbi:ankyrin repeat-containing domain protein [Clohesyomyces aquaticus]|uniref:Ankyrin repeat-containing domain protein n=1 Tax=Clohesyomyces aquaticus TaxID=1231657 RepID=A0A1Y1ZQX8_9PLEO|nr:ankyrin repeat-containing domain protein [Clohesyomyces aquaticus]
MSIATTSRILSLANELILDIADRLDCQADLSSLSRVNHRLHNLLTPHLLKWNIRREDSSALFWAVKRKRLTLARQLLHLGANVNTSCHRSSCRSQKDTPLLGAIRARSLDMVTLLVEAGADVLLNNEFGFRCTPICAAINGEHRQILLYLMSRLESLDAHLDHLDHENTALSIAVRERRVGMVKALLKAGANPNCGTREGVTPLLRLLYNDSGNLRQGLKPLPETYVLARLMLKCGADPDHRYFDTSPRAVGLIDKDPRVRELFANAPAITRGGSGPSG